MFFFEVKNFVINNVFWILSVLSFFVIAFFFYLTYFYFGNFPPPIVIYLQHPGGEKFLGGIDDIYGYGIFGLAVFLTNFGLGYFLRNRIKAIAMLLASFNLIIQIILFIILMQIYSFN